LPFINAYSTPVLPALDANVKTAIDAAFDAATQSPYIKTLATAVEPARDEAFKPTFFAAFNTAIFKSLKHTNIAALHSTKQPAIDTPNIISFEHVFISTEHPNEDDAALVSTY